MNKNVGEEAPVYPLRLILKDGEVQTLRDEEHVALYLEFFDSDSMYDLDRLRVENIADALNRPVSLLVKLCDVLRCELKEVHN